MKKKFKKIEAAILEIQNQQRDLKPFTQKQLINRAIKSNNDFIAGKYKTQEQLEKESEKW